MMWDNPGHVPGLAVTRHRYGAQTIGTDGRPNRAAASSVSLTDAVVRDLDDREVRSLPEGWKLAASIGVTTQSELRGADQATGIWSDVIEVNGERHVVVKVGSGPPVGSLPRIYDAMCSREPERGPNGWPT